MIVGIGIDLVSVPRMEEITRRWGTRFIRRVFTSDEEAYCLGYRLPAIHFSGRFAVKEAVLKALGIGYQMGARWRDIETVRQKGGHPMVRLTGALARLAQAQGVTKIFVSISHDHNYAVSHVILEE